MTRASVELISARVLGVFFASAGVLKLFDFPKFAAAYAAAGHPRWVFFGTGVVEVGAGVVLVLMPRFRVVAAWALLGMILLIGWRPWMQRDRSLLAAQVITISALVAIVSRGFRRPPLPTSMSVGGDGDIKRDRTSTLHERA